MVLHHSDGTVALDTVIDFPAGTDSETVSLDVKLLPSAPASGEPLSLNLAYINAAGDTVFKGGPVGVTAAPAGSGPPPPPVTIPVTYSGPGASAAGVAITPRSATVVAGGSFTFTAVAVDGSGNPVPSAPIVWNTLDPSIASVPNASVGFVTAGNTRGTARIVAQLLTGQIDQVSLTVLPNATAIAASSGSGQTAFANASLTNPLVVLVTAGDGLGVGGVTVNFAVATGGGSVGSASAVTNASGFAQTTWKLGSAVGTQTVTASASGLTGSPVTFTATAKAVSPTHLAIGSQPANAVAGAALPAISVIAQTDAGDTASTFTGAVTLALGGGTSGAVLGGTATVNAVGGVATFTGLTVSKAGTGYTLAASSTGLTGATTNTFDITAASAGKLTFTAQPLNSTVGNSVGALAVTALDNFGNVSTTFTGLVTLGIQSNPGAATLTGVTSANAVAGVANFASVFLNRPGTGYTLSASATGLTAATSNAFDIGVGTAANLVLLSGGGQSGTVGGALPQPVVVQVQDVGGNGVSGKTVTFAVVTGGGSLSVASGVSDASGNVSTTWTLGGTTGAQQISATAAGLGGSPLAINATAAAALNHFSVSTQPALSQTAGVNVTPGFVVTALDASNAVITGFTGTVTLSIGSNPGGSTLSGTTSVSAVAGVATFSAFKLDKVGTGYTVTANSAGFTAITSSAFNIVAGAATQMAINGGNAQTAAQNAALPTALSVLVTDAGGNPVAGRTITWAIATGGGSLDSVTSVTNASGIGSRKWTLGATAGAQSVTATATGLTGSPLTFTATATSGIASTTVAPKLANADTITSLGATLAMTATARDGANTVVAGTYTWASRTPATATVTNAGVVTAVANGTTWIVATETGGTKDSALVTVAQVLTTINVTPGTRSIYRGASFSFTAQAVDGLGHPLVVQPTIRWSSTIPSRATVDSITGHVSALSLGTLQIQATAGAIVGVSNVTIVTPITTITVGRDSSGTPVNDTTSVTSLGLGRRFVAVAHDTLGAAMTGVTFAWTSTNTSVALLDSLYPAAAHALSNANGTTTIQAVADGITGTTALKVAQVLAAIDLSPTPDTIGITGTVQLTARGKDANSRYISGGTFTYTSRSTSIATVASSGIVTGVTLGTDTVTASSGAITSNAAQVVVASTVPPIISFGRDTLSVGRGSSTSIPVLLSRPNATSVTVNLAARDTFAYFSVASVTFTPGQTSQNVTLNGRNAGTTQIYATDGSSTGYKGDTSTVTVQANIRFSTSSWYLNAGDQVSAQVLLSDPSPAGGTYVTYSYGTPGRATVSPDPAFIPAGQLASNVVITSLGSTTGSTTITPVATGVNGAASTLNISAPVITISAGATARLGAGQYENGWYVYVPQYSNVAIPLSYRSTDTTVATVSPAVGSIPAGTNYQYFTVSGIAAGTASIIVSATGWTPDTLVMTITKPHVGVCCNNNLVTTSPTQNLTIYAEDSLGTGHYRTSALAVTVSSTDTSVVKVIDQNPTIAAGQYYVNGVRYQPGSLGGSAYIRVQAGGHTSDSVLVNVAGPKLEFSWCCTVQLGTGQFENGYYVYAPNNVATALAVNLTSANPAKVSVPASVTIPAGTNYSYFTVSALDTTGSNSIIASAIGYQGDTAYVKVSTPRVSLSGGGTFNNFNPNPIGFTVYSEDSVGTGHYQTAPLAVSIHSTNTSVITVDSSSLTITAGAYYVNTAHVHVAGIGTAYLVTTAPGHSPDSALYTVQTPKLNFNFTTSMLGRRQLSASTDFYVYTPDTRTSALAVTVTQKHGAVDSLTTTTPNIPSGTNYTYFGAAGLTVGTDTLIASASGYQPDTAFFTVSTTKFTGGGIPSTANTTNPNYTTTVYATDVNGTGHYVMDTVVVHVTSSDTTVIKPTQAYVRILPGQYYVQPSYQYFGPGSAYLTFTDSAGNYASLQSNTVTVTGPSLVFNNTSAMYGMRQQGSGSDYYVYTQNNVTSPVTVTLVSTDPRVATVPATVTIPAGTNYVYFNIVAQDTVGTIQIQASASGFGPPSPITVQVTQPKFVVNTSTQARTTQGPQTITVYATDANGSAHYTTEAVTVNLASSAGAVFNLDSNKTTNSVVIPSGAYYTQASHWNPVAVGSAQLSASDSRATIYAYGTGSANLTVVTPSLSFSWSSFSIGLGQYVDQAHLCCFYVATPDNLAAGANVTLGHAGPATTSIPSTTPIASASYYSYFTITGTSLGTDTLTATLASPFHNSAKTFMTVDYGRVYLSGWPSALANTTDSVAVTLYTRDPTGSYNLPVAAATTFTLAPNANIEFRSGGVSSTVITSITVPANAIQSPTFYVKGKTTGSGSVTITNANYYSFTNPVTVP